MRTAKYSLYPNPRVRILSHVVAWISIFSLFLVTSKALFRADLTAPPVILYSVIVLFVILFNHYFLSVTRISSANALGKWAFFAGKLLLLYVFSAVVTIGALKILADGYPGYPVFRTHSNHRNFHHLTDVFSYETFIWVTTVVIFYNLTLFFVKFAKSAYETNMENVLLTTENVHLELDFLRSQIQPHFLFNTLNNIYGLVLNNSRASDSILKLSDLLRFSLYESKSPKITLKRESEFLADYINLEQMRHHKRVTITYDCKEIEDDQQLIAPLLLVNFIENAFKHGINASIGEAWVRIFIKTKDGLITFTVENSKPADEISYDDQMVKEGLGLANTRRRLDLIYPDKHKLIIEETETRYVVQLFIYTS